MFLSYCRVSTNEQKEGTSPEEQERKTRAIAALTNPDPYALTHYYDGGVSGSIPLGERPQGKRMLEEAKKGDTIIVTKLDRIFRSAVDALTTTKNFARVGLNLIIIDMGVEPVTSSSTGKLFFGMLALMAEFERDRILERTLDGRRAKRAAGGHIGGEPPFGFRKRGEGKEAKLIPDREEQDVLKYLVYLYNKRGYTSEYRLTQIFNEMGITSRSGKPLQVTQMQRMLRSARELELISG